MTTDRSMDRQTDRQDDGQTDRTIDRQYNGHTGRWTYRQDDGQTDRRTEKTDSQGPGGAYRVGRGENDSQLNRQTRSHAVSKGE